MIPLLSLFQAWLLATVDSLYLAVLWLLESMPTVQFSPDNPEKQYRNRSLGIRRKGYAQECQCHMAYLSSLFPISTDSAVGYDEN